MTNPGNHGDYHRAGLTHLRDAIARTLSNCRVRSREHPFMIDRRHRLQLLGLGLLAFSLPGCASSGASSVSTWKPGYGWYGNATGANSQRTWNGPLVQPGTGLQPTPAMTSPPTIAPGPGTGPMLPDASGNRYRPFPSTMGVRHPYPQGRTRQQQRMLTPIAPHPGSPIARDPMPSLQTPAELSGEIEIIPGPTLRARRARMEMLPPPPDATAASPAQEPSQTPVEELPRPVDPTAE